MTHASLSMPYEIRLALAECFVGHLKSRPTSCAEWSAQTRGTLLASGLVARLGPGVGITSAGKIEVLSWGRLWPGNAA